MNPNVMLKFAVKREQSQACLAMPSVSKLNKVKRVQHDGMIISLRSGNVGMSACSVRGFLLTQIAIFFDIT